MDLKVEIFFKQELNNLLRKGEKRDAFLDISFKHLLDCKEILEGLDNEVPYYLDKRTKIKSDIGNNKLELKTLTHIICVFAKAPLSNSAPHRVEYDVTDFQKFFIHLNKEQLKAIDLKFGYRKKYNDLFDVLIGEDHHFGKLMLDEDWNIVGENCEPIEKIQKYLINLGGIDENDFDKIDKEKTLFNQFKQFVSKNKLVFSICVALVLCVITFLVVYPFSEEKVPVISEPVSEAVFDNQDERFKIMILPFDDECEYEGTMNNIGKVIELRLEELNFQDTLNLNVRYIPDFIIKKEKKDSSWNAYYKRIAEINNADQLIYGATREDNCSGTGLDEICINYVFSSDFYNRERGLEKTQYRFQPTTREAITKGKLQGDINFIVYMNALYSQQERDFKKSMNYINRILNSPDISHKNLLFAKAERMNLIGLNFDPSSLASEDARFILKNDTLGVMPYFIKIHAKNQLQDTTVIQDINKYIESEPDFYYPYFLRGFYYGLREDTLRLNDFHKSIGMVKEQEKLIPIYQTIAGWYSDRFQWGESIEWHIRALNISENHRSRESIGICLYYIEAYEQSEYELECALSLKDDDLKTLLWTARLNLINGDIQTAIDLYRKSISNNSELATYLTTILDLISKNNYEYIIEFIKDAETLFKDDPYALYALSYCQYIYEVAKDNSIEAEIIGNALLEYPDDYENWLFELLFSLGFSFTH